MSDPVRTSTSRATAALAHPDFRRFWLAQLVSLIGGWMHQTAMAWLVWRMTKSATLLGVMAFAGNAPVLLLGFPAGALVDRFERRKLVFGAQAAEMTLTFLTAWLAWTGRVQVWHLITIATLIGICISIEVPARQTMFGDLVGRESLMSAIALNSASFSASRVIGPSLAGLLLGHISEASCFLLNGFSFVGALFALTRMNPPPQPAVRTGAAFSMWDGVRYISSRPDMRSLIVMVGAANLFGIPYTQFLPVYVAEELGMGARALGFYQAAVGLGALGAVFLAASRDPASLTPRLATTGFVGFSVALFLFAAAPSFATGLVLLALLGFAGATQMATTNNFLQSRAPEELRGRVVAVYTTTFIGLFPIGCLMVGRLADAIGVRATFACGASICLAVALTMRFSLPLEAGGEVQPADGASGEGGDC